MLLHSRYLPTDTLNHSLDKASSTQPTFLSTVHARLQDPAYFVPPTAAHLEAYDAEKVAAVRNDDLHALRRIHGEGRTMRASNRFGETLLHVACRRGRASMVRFFLSSDAEEEQQQQRMTQEPKASSTSSAASTTKAASTASYIPRVEARVRDDLGRTPMHDLCWSSAFPDHGAMLLLVRAAPELLLAKDARGFSPFDYARREHWASWVSFLKQYEEFVVGCLVRSTFARLQQQLQQRQQVWKRSLSVAQGMDRRLGAKVYNRLENDTNRE